MINGRIRRITCAKMAWGALALVIAGSVHATTLVGGGTTLPALGYVGSNAATQLQVFGTNVASGSLFGVDSSTTPIGAPAFSYCETGDDASKNIFAGVTTYSSGLTTPYNVQNSCTKNATGTITGFGAALSGVNRTDLAQPDFAAVDSPLNASDYLNYQNNHTSGDYPVQFPAVAGAVAIAFNLRDNTGAQVTSSEVNLSDTQVCLIFSDQITSWNDTRLASAFTLPAGHSIPANPINVQYRSDGSGTTFSLSNHLANVCGTINSSVFETSQAFTSVVANFINPVPTNWTGSSGDESLAEALGNTANSIAYVSTANALATNTPLQIADVNGTNPVNDFGGPFTITDTAFVYNEVMNTTNNTNGTAQLEAISSIPGVVNPPTTSCIALVKPALYAKPGVSGGVVPTGTYPIVAISYLLANAEGNGADLLHMKRLLIAPYGFNFTSRVTTIGPGTGLAFLTLGTNAFTISQVSGCLVN
ncbi:substrate-binding domain-containing protein [Dyella humi]|uniref:Substrate-binding domain-containing protein n=1 Tax=Dyella humi TaxID=1770547 RepID=A0ABW8IN01_9GAMM